MRPHNSGICTLMNTSIRPESSNEKTAKMVETQKMILK